MALQVRSIPEAVAYALATAHNASWRAYVAANTSFPHADITSTPSGDWQHPAASSLQVTAAAATTLALVITSANQALSVMQIHFADALAHATSDTTNFTTVDALDQLASTATQGATDTQLNAMKAAFNLHLAQNSVHYTNDTTNAIVAADASDLATSETLADAIKAAVNAHITFAGDTQLLDVKAP